MRRIVTSAIALGTLAAATPALAAEDEQVWPAVTVNVDLGDGFKLQNEVVVRVGDAKGFYELEENLMVGRAVAKDVTLWLGYTHNPQYLDGDFTVMEHRFRQQVAFDNLGKIGAGKLSGRLRLEERWRDGVSGTGWRLRPQVKVSFPLVGKTSLAVSHESFINLSTTAFQAKPGYDRMRNAIAVSFPIGAKVKGEAGYLNQYGFKPNAPDTVDHVLTLGLTASF